MNGREKVIKGLEHCRIMCEGVSLNPCSGCPYQGHYTCADRLKTDALALLKEQEAVVRCKDCKWWDKKDDSNYGYCHACKHGYYSDHWEIGIYRTYKGDWFCADGERREYVKPQAESATDWDGVE